MRKPIQNEIPTYEFHIAKQIRKKYQIDDSLFSQSGNVVFANFYQVRVLADGSIYGAPEALEKKLIDKVGYLGSAIAEAESLAGIKDAKVIEYERPFSLSSMLSSQGNSMLNIDRDSLREMAAPQLLYLWDADFVR